MTPPPPSPIAPSPRGQQTRALLLEAAYQQFVSRGYHGTSMRSIAEAAGITVGGIYNHFAGKEEIFKAVILAHHPISVILPELLQAQGEDLESLLRDAATRFQAHFQERPGLFNLLFIELIECQGRHLSELLAAFLPQMAQLGQRLESLPGLRADLSPMAFLRAFLANLFAYQITEQLLQEAGASDNLGNLEDFIQIFLHGALTPPDDTA